MDEMTARDKFAAAALIGLLASKQVMTERQYAAKAFQLADDMEAKRTGKDPDDD